MYRIQIYHIKVFNDILINLKLSFVVEGIENEILLDNKCNIRQGHLFSKLVEPSYLKVIFEQMISRL
jgi:hypothetical protein